MRAQHVKTDTRVQPRPQVPVEQDPQLRVVANVGGAMLFSAAQLHSTVPNTSGITRYSIDFRTVHLDDVCASPARPTLTRPAPARRWGITCGHRFIASA